jgi:ABC-2 type transport system ATP-binding protein
VTGKSQVHAIVTERLSREYRLDRGKGVVAALNKVSLQIEDGEIRGLLGPNGAGKTTLTKILSTVLLPSSGSATILGYNIFADLYQIRKSIGFVLGGDLGFYPHLTGRQNLKYWSALYEVPIAKARHRIPSILDRVGLSGHADSNVQTYSRGMKQRLHLAKSLINDARILFLDEPTMGMDPVAARDFRRLLLELRSEGKTILLTTHDMGEAESICDQVALIDHGCLLALETPARLARLVSCYHRIDFDSNNPELADKIRFLQGVTAVTLLTPEHRFRVELEDESATNAVLTALVAAGVTWLQSSRPSLEEVYIHVIGNRGMQI